MQTKLVSTDLCVITAELWIWYLSHRIGSYQARHTPPTENQVHKAKVGLCYESRHLHAVQSSLVEDERNALPRTGAAAIEELGDLY